MGNCSSTSNCNPCGPNYSAINQLATKAGAYARQANSYSVDAQNAWLEFNALYLGAFAVAPTVDNEGDPLQEGALYWNTGTNLLYAWDGSVWVVATNFNEFTPFLAIGTTFARNLFTREADVVNVKDFGAVGDGVTDDTAAFSAAAIAAQAGNPQGLQRPGILFCDWSIVYVPSGNYLLSSFVDTGNKEIVWDTHVDASIINPQNLNGRLWRAGSKTTDFHHGILDYATSFSITANRNADELAQVSGFTNPNQLSRGNGRDSVTCYLGNQLPSAFYGDASVASYSASGAILSTPLNTNQLNRLRRGMIVQTRHSPQPYAGMLDSWASDGTSITVQGWYLVDGSPSGSPTTPTGTNGLDINIFRKSWALNANTFIDANSYGNAINCVEFGVRNDKGEPTSRAGSIESNGVYSVALDSGSSFYNDASFITGGKWTYGYLARSGCTHAFYYDGSSGNQSGEPFSSLIYGINNSGIRFFQVKQDGAVEIGLRGSGVATPATIDFHSGATDSDYDSRISSGGGTGSPLGGSLNYQALEHIFQGTPRPNADILVNFGRIDRRWLVGYFKELRPGDGNVRWTSGTGSPEGALTAPVGSIYTDTSGGVGTTLYVKESGVGNTGWVAK